MSELKWAPLHIRERIRRVVHMCKTDSVGVGTGPVCRIKRNPFTGLSKPGPY